MKQKLPVNEALLIGTGDLLAVVLQIGDLIPRGTRANVFQRIFWAFLILGTLVGVIVIGYMLYNGYKYRADGKDPEDDADRPTLGELPQGGGKGRKLFTSFGLSTLVVVSLIVWTYGTLLYVESPPGYEEGGANQIEIEVIGHQFFWEFVYPNGHSTQNTLRVPRGVRVKLIVTSNDVFHNFGVPELRVKTDAIPGQDTDTWFRANETENYTAACFELCGAGHSYMNAQVVVMEPDEYQEWYANVNASG